LPKIVSVQAPSSARVVATEDKQGWLVHLIRIQQETGGILLEPDGSIEVRCDCRPGWPVRSVCDAISGKVIPHEHSGESVRFSREVSLHEIVRIEKESSDGQIR